MSPSQALVCVYCYLAVFSPCHRRNVSQCQVKSPPGRLTCLPSIAGVKWGPRALVYRIAGGAKSWKAVHKIPQGLSMSETVPAPV